MSQHICLSAGGAQPCEHACGSNTPGVPSPDSQMGWQLCCVHAWLCLSPRLTTVIMAHLQGPTPVPVLLFSSFRIFAYCPSCGQPGSTTAGLTSKVSNAEPCFHSEELLCPYTNLHWPELCICVFLLCLWHSTMVILPKQQKLVLSTVTFWKWDISGNPAEHSGKKPPTSPGCL